MTQLLDFLRNESAEPWLPIMAWTVVSGIANGAVLALINAGASAAASDALSFRLLLMFLITIMVYILTKKRSLNRGVAVVEGLVKRLRVRVCDKIRKSELPFIETLGKGQLYTTVSQDTNLISQSAFVIIHATQGAIMVIFALIYIAWISVLAFFVIIGSIGIALIFYYNHRKSMLSELGELSLKEAEFVDSLAHIIDGFKEAKLNRKKNDSLFASFTDVATTAKELKVSLGIKVATDVMFSHVFFCLLIGIIVFLLPRYVPTFNVVVLEMTSAVLFIIAPLEMVVNAIPMLARANVAIHNLYSLENRLDKHLEYFQEEAEPQPPAFKEAILLQGAVFTYYDSDNVPSFTVGPLDLQVEQGKILFITGGNGAGKTTLLKALTGLYPLTKGVMRLDRRPLNSQAFPAYRELFSAIFSDFHLFDRFYGLEGVDEKKVKRWIKRLGLAGKTDFRNGRFTNLNLSTGQKKRLALIIALLEDREVYVFDEWAADQDVQFRYRFYYKVLRYLKRNGKTVVAVTHDDRYWEVADRRVELVIDKEGSKILDKTNSAPQPVSYASLRKKDELS